ncbi:MAG: hypothetical protein FWC80_04985 [Firmicutes bacterium]|nr:hypothetical protein [Bacillota bacterium]
MKQKDWTLFGVALIGLVVLFVATLFGMAFVVVHTNYREQDRTTIYRTYGEWTYRRLDGGGVAVVSLRRTTAVMDASRTITIPTEISGRRVTRLGDFPWQSGQNGGGRSFLTGSINIARADRIVVPDGIFVAETFWRGLAQITDYVEFLAGTPNMVLGQQFESRIITLIVPDGSGARYRENFGRANIIERSNYNDHPIWRYYRLNDSEVMIDRLRNLDLALGDGNVLTIPTEINGLRVTRLGSTDITGSGQIFLPSRNTRLVERMVIPEGIYVERTFWREFVLTNSVEMLSSDPTYLARGSQVGLSGIALIVPYGSRDAYLEHLEWSTWLNIEERQQGGDGL